MEKLEKRIKNSSGDLLIRKSGKEGGCGIVELLHLWSKNESGCVIGCWQEKKSDESYIAEFSSIDDRIITTEYDNSDMLLDALKFGQKLADLIIETNQTKSN